MPRRARWPDGRRVLSIGAVLQAMILIVTLIGPAVVAADEPTTDPNPSPPATEPADPATSDPLSPDPEPPATPEPASDPIPPDPDPALSEPAPEPPPNEPAAPLAPAACGATGAEAIATDRFDYAPEETVAVSGTGFAADCLVTVRVTRPDGSIVVGDGSFAPGSDTVTTGADGALSYAYVLDGIDGEYLLQAVGDAGLVLAETIFMDAVPMTSPILYSDAAYTTEAQAFERGDTVYVKYGPITLGHLAARYTTSLVQPDGTILAGSTSACLTPDVSGYLLDSKVLSQAAFSTVSAARWRYRITLYPTVGCSGTPDITRQQTFHVFQAFAYSNATDQANCISDATCVAPTPVFVPGDDVYLKIAVSQASRNFTGMMFIKPDGSAACTIGPLTSDANGAVSFLYPSGACPPIGSTASDIGLWTMDVTAVGSATPPPFGFIPKFTTNIPAFVVKAPLTVTTTIHDATHVPVTGDLALGSIVHDTANVAGLIAGLVAPDPTFTLYDGASCTGEGVPVAGGGADNGDLRSIDVGPLPAGLYSFKASLAESNAYLGDDSDCEPLTVLMATPTVVTEMHRETLADPHVVVASPSAIPFGSVIHDLAIVTGVTGIVPTGTIEYKLFKGASNCSGTLISTETVPVGSESSSTSALPFGRYTYLATYSGDANYYGPVSAGCEIVETGKGTPTIETEIHAGLSHVDIQATTVELGTIVHDAATVTGIAGIEVTGQVRYELFGNDACTAGTGQPLTTLVVAVGAESALSAPLAAGSYSYLATYLGDENYRSVTAACETLTVDKATPTIRTEVHAAPHVIVAPPTAAIALGSIVHDVAIFGGQVDGFVIDGLVTYTLYRTAFGEPAQNCSGPVYAGAEVVAVGGETTPVGPLPTGRYTYLAVYGGNDNYEPVTAACEIFEVAKATPVLETVVHREAELNEHTPVANPGVVLLGSTVHDRAFFGGKVDGFDITGTVTFTLFKGAANCTGEIVAGPDTVSIEPMTESPSFGPLTAGRYTYLAHYNGNANYTAVDAVRCEIFEVPKGVTTTATELHEGSRDSAAPHFLISVGGYTFSPTVHDLATVNGEVPGVPMTGQVKYVFFTNTNPWASVCDGTPRLIEYKNVGEESSDRVDLPPGQYAFRAQYLGDANYQASTSACEPFTIVPNNAVTSSSLCTFDFDATAAGSQFRLIYTPDIANPVYKLTASNPGQFFYNVFYTGVGGEAVTLTIPAPFVTQGATPVHVYSSVIPVTIDGVTCYTPGPALEGAVITDPIITGTAGGTITVDLPSLSGGFAYIAVHLDYGWKKTLTGCARGLLDQAICTVPSDVTIGQGESYTFGFTNGSSGSATVSSVNEFKKNPGVGGSLLKGTLEDPVVGATIEVWLGSKKLGSTRTDLDGWFMWSYKYTGKPATFTVKVPSLGIVKSAILKSNGFIVFGLTTP